MTEVKSRVKLRSPQLQSPQMTSGRFHIRETETYTVSKNKKMSKIKYTSLHASKIIYVNRDNSRVTINVNYKNLLNKDNT